MSKKARRNNKRDIRKGTQFVKAKRMKKKRNSDGMMKVFAKNDCGCCTTEMFFQNAESASKAFSKVGFGNGMSIVDDMGTTHEGIDTFYGFSVDEDKQEDKGLDYLGGLLGLKV